MGVGAFQPPLKGLLQTMDCSGAFNGSSQMKRIAILCSVAAAMLVAGCQPLGYLLYLVAPEQTDKFEAEYKGLPGHTVAVVVFANYDVCCDHPMLQLELTSQVSAQFEDTEKFKDVKTIDPRRVLKYQNENVNWDAMDKTELARKLSADYVLLITVEEFSTRESGSMSLYRGSMMASAALYQASKKERESKVWPTGTSEPIRVAYPKKGMGRVQENDTAIRVNTEHEFAEVLAKKFYKHEEKKE